MRGVLIFLLAVALGLVFLHQKRQEAASPATKPVATQAQSVGAKPAAAPQLTPAPRGEASKYNYMKRALDRAADVRDHAREQTKASQDP